MTLIFCVSAVQAEDILRQTIIETAKLYQGVAYRYGAESPKGFDCSGFVRYVYRTAAGIDLPRSSRNIWASGRSIPIAEAQPGDIVVFAAQKGGPVDHVAILMDRNSIIHAVSQGPKTGVIISPLTDRYFGPRILGVKTFILAPTPTEPAEIDTASIPPEAPDLAET
ncbi:MAG: C40 family peptidase [Spirochaetaceae bacterium]|jgi:cell wall-associated NlpC family hydrolase|nr:C40 family peptidase [Spirochaetaceae bacterium]